jgi:hypothetical protein
VTVVVDLPAIRPSRLADGVGGETLGEHVRAFREFLRGAEASAIDGGLRLTMQLDVRVIARLADLVRSEADGLPFWSFRLLADPPACRLEVTGGGHAGALARAVFGELAR